MVENVLKSLGLADKEIDVYLVALEVGSQPASTIATRVKLPRNTARFILDKLVDKGIMKKSMRANTQLYAPEEPKTLLNLLERERINVNASIDDKVKELTEVMAELETRYRPESRKPKVTFYEGDEGVIKVYEDTLTSDETIRSFFSFDALHGVLPEYFETYYNRRAAKDISARSISPDTELARKGHKISKKVARDSKLVPSDKYNFSPEIQFYNNKVSITSLKEKLGIIIESEEIYNAMIVVFELAWKEAERLHKKRKK